MKANKYIATIMATTMVASSVGVVGAQERQIETIIGKNRIETAIKISQEGWKSAETVILVNDSAIPDALTATPLAFAKNAPILLTGKDGLNKATAEEIKRLDAKDVIMIGGDAVLSSNIEKDLKALNVKVDRIKGATREETALAIAKRLDGIKDVSEIAVVNGTNGLADAVSVAATAAERNMPILLANPKKGLAISEKFIKDENINISYIIGGKTVLPDKLVSKLPGKQRIEGLDRKDTNAKVIEKFYTGKELDNVYLAKDGMGDSGQLIDALAVGALAAKNGAPVLIASKKLSEKQIDVINTKRIDTITQVGGNGNEKAFSELKEIEKEVVIKVKSELELQEALDKANANDIIEIEEGVNISNDMTLSTNNAIQIYVKGELKGEVTVKTPNADIKNSGTIGTLVVENGKNTTVTNSYSGKIDKVEIDSSSENVKVENNGTITEIENNAKGTEIENYGTISKPITGTTTPEVDGNKPGGGSSGGSSSGGGTVIEGIYVTDEETLSKAIENAKKGETIVLANDITLSKVMKLSPSGETTINLNNYTLDSKKIKFDKDTKAPIESIGVNQTLTIKNGKLNLNSISPTNSCISVGKDGTFNLEDVVYTSETTGVYAIGENATINIIDSTISAYVYCIGTNAGELANYNSIFNIEGSTINMTSNVGGDAILINVPCKFYMNNSTVNSDYQGIIVRGGTATISNTTITNIIDDKYKDQNNYINENWKTGNEVPCGGLIIGNRGGGYQYPSNVELKNVTIKDGNKNDPYPAVYMWGNDGDGLGATLTHEGCTIDGDIILGNDKCTINGEKGPLPKPVEPEKPTQPETTTK